ncbi:PALM2-AKAP2 fusion protein-like isoform X2 [Heterodontus francisci]|uniref:PALM2-AKAP2 fusion protein-like isoform X2 n=1 Tax=Heterodontus francisci TaxID=7792 RepID=UPI00355BF61E
MNPKREKSPTANKPSAFLGKVKKNGEELKENVIDMGDRYSPSVTMETSEDISACESTFVDKSITMETEVTENGTIHQGKVNGTAERKYSGFKDQKQILNTCTFIAENVKETSDRNHGGNINEMSQESQGEVFKMEGFNPTEQVPFAFEAVPPYEMPEVIYAIIHKDHFNDSSATVFGGAAANSVAATVVPEVNEKEMLKTYQSTNEAKNEAIAPVVTRPKKYSTANPSLIDLNEGILETFSEVRQNEENVENFSAIDLSKLTIESSTPLVISQNDKSLGLLATSLNGPIKSFLASNCNQIPNKSMMYQRESETIPSANQNEFLPSTTLLQYMGEFESAHTDKFKCIKKHSNANHHHRDLIQENGPDESLTSLSKKLMLEIMELQHRSIKSNPNQNEVKSQSSNTKPQSAEQIPEQKGQTKASGNENVDTEHMDFATARRQWLMLEKISRTHGPRSPVKQQKNKTVTKRIIKELLNDPSVTKLMKREASYPRSASFSEDKVQSNTSIGIKIDEMDSWRSLTNLNNKQDVLALQENDGTMGDLEQNLFLNRADFSVCSEGSDSGLDDSTCRSEGDNLTDAIFHNETSSSLSVMHGKPETPIEREIRLGVKREESLRKARGITKHACSEEYVEIKTRPLILQPVTSPSAKVKNNQFAEMQMQREILLERQREEDLVHKGKVKGTYDKSLISEIEERRKFFEQRYPFPLPPSSKMFIPHINTPAALLATSPIIKKCPSNNEINVHNVRLENGVLTSEEDKTGDPDAVLNLKCPPVETAHIIILETPDVITRHSSDCTLSSISSLQKEETLQKNPFYKLRSHGSQSILSQEIREVLQREEELRKQRCNLHGTATVHESSMSSLTNLPPGYISNENSSQDCPGSALGGSYMC